MLRCGDWQSASSQCHFDLRCHGSLKNSYKDGLHNIVIYFRLQFCTIFEQIMVIIMASADNMTASVTILGGQSNLKTQNSKNANFAQKMFNPTV